MIGTLFAVTLLSTSFAKNAAMPLRLAAKPCGGENRSPELQWNGVPHGAKSLAIVMHDPDAPRTGGFTHWVLYDVPATTTSLPENATTAAENAGANDTGSAGYFGPCPPPGRAHHYNITLYALDVAHVGATQPLTEAQLLARIKGHVIAQTTLTGLFATSPR